MEACHAQASRRLLPASWHAQRSYPHLDPIPLSTALTRLQDPSYVVRELYEAVQQAGEQYEAAGPGPPRGGGSGEGQGVNMEDVFARLHLARLCALVVHSDQAAGDVTRDGAPFWRMLVLLATRCVGESRPREGWEAAGGARVSWGGMGGLGRRVGASRGCSAPAQPSPTAKSLALSMTG